MFFNFNGSYSNKSKDLFKITQEKDLRKISSYLKTPMKDVKSIKFEVFDTREGKQNVDPHHSISRASARFNEMTVYRFWEPKDNPHYPHEMTHLIAHTWAKPYKWQVKLDTWDGKTILKIVEMVSTSFMQEGLAIAVDDIVFRRKLLEEGGHKLIDDWCREQVNNVPAINDVVNFKGFSSFENKLVVPFSASLSKYLIQSFGLGKYKRMYVSLKETLSPGENTKTIESVYKLKEKELLDNWQLYISR